MMVIAFNLGAGTTRSRCRSRDVRHVGMQQETMRSRIGHRPCLVIVAFFRVLDHCYENPTPEFLFTK